jgi:hypothetical protein
MPNVAELRAEAEALKELAKREPNPKKRRALLSAALQYAAKAERLEREVTGSPPKP